MNLLHSRLAHKILGIKEDPRPGQFYCFLHTLNFPTADALKRHIWVEHPGLTPEEAKMMFERIPD